jgi:hypothetical protein
MAFKITVERVDNGAKANGSYPTRETNSGDLPIQVILQEVAATGVTLSVLKGFLALGMEGELDTAITAAQSGDTVSLVIARAIAQTM